MSQQNLSTIDHLFAMKAELEKLGCKVEIDPEPDADGFMTVRVTYPRDVPPPSLSADEVRS